MRTEAVLRRRDSERRRKEWKKTAFKKFRGRPGKRDRTLRSGSRRWLSQLRDRENQSLLPDRGKDRVTDR